MDRTQGANYTTADGKRQFTDGPPGTTVEEVFLNGVQEELMSVIEGEGYTPSSASDTQLYSAVVDIANSAASTNMGRGALVYRSNVQAIVSNAGTYSLITWSQADWDTSNCWSATNPGRLTVPAGVTKVRLTGFVSWEYDALGFRRISIYKGGSPTFVGSYLLLSESAGSADGYNRMQIHTAVLSVTAGNYFELWASTNMGGAGTLDVLDTSWFQMEIIA